MPIGTVTPVDPSTPAPAAPAPVGATSPSGLTAEHVQALQAARWEARKISRAAGVAAFSGWTLASFATITVLTGIFSIAALLLGVGMGVIALIEIKGSKRLRRLDTTAPRHLGFNQLALGVMIVLYGAWGMAQAALGPSPYDDHIAAGGEVGRMLEPIAALNTLVAVCVYAALILGGGAATGFAALYYFTRRAHMVVFLRRTPEWVVETMRAVH